MGRGHARLGWETCYTERINYHPIVNRKPTPLKDQIRGSVISGHFLRIGKCWGSVINTQKISGIPGGHLLTLKNLWESGGHLFT